MDRRQFASIHFHFTSNIQTQTLTFTYTMSVNKKIYMFDLLTNHSWQIYCTSPIEMNITFVSFWGKSNSRYLFKFKYQIVNSLIFDFPQNHTNSNIHFYECCDFSSSLWLYQRRIQDAFFLGWVFQIMAFFGNNHNFWF